MTGDVNRQQGQLARVLEALRAFRTSQAGTASEDAGDASGSWSSLWMPRARDSRLTVRNEVAEMILEKIVAAGGRADTIPNIAVIVAHPDDEAIGAGAALRGIPGATIVHVTDGAPADEEYAQRRGFPSREAYAKARRDEVVAALEVIGIPQERIRGLGFVDGEAAWHLLELCDRVARLLDELQPDAVITHPYEGGHSDHDSTAFAVHLAAGILRRDGRHAPVILELTSYHNHNGQRRLFEFIPFLGTTVKTRLLSEDDREVKRQMFDAFTSQSALLRTIPIEIEKFRTAPRYLFNVPPHDGQLDYERLCRKMTGAEWRQLAETALQRLRSKPHFKGGLVASDGETQLSAGA